MQCGGAHRKGFCFKLKRGYYITFRDPLQCRTILDTKLSRFHPTDNNQHQLVPGCAQQKKQVHGLRNCVLDPRLLTEAHSCLIKIQCSANNSYSIQEHLSIFYILDKQPTLKSSMLYKKTTLWATSQKDALNPG